MSDSRYTFDVVKVLEVTDGDTCILQLRESLAFYETRELRVIIRLVGPDAGIDCPEKRRGTTFEKAEGRRAELVAREWLTAPGRQLRCRTVKPHPDAPPVGDGGFGRWLGDIWDDATGQHLADVLLGLRLASVWPKRWRDVYDVIPPATT